MLSVAYRSHKGVTENLDQLTAQKGRESAGKLKGVFIDLYLCKAFVSDLMNVTSAPESVR